MNEDRLDELRAIYVLGLIAAGLTLKSANIQLILYFYEKKIDFSLMMDIFLGFLSLYAILMLITLSEIFPKVSIKIKGLSLVMLQYGCYSIIFFILLAYAQIQPNSSMILSGGFILYICMIYIIKIPDTIKKYNLSKQKLQTHFSFHIDKYKIINFIIDVAKSTLLFSLIIDIFFILLINEKTFNPQSFYIVYIGCIFFYVLLGYIKKYLPNNKLKNV